MKTFESRADALFMYSLTDHVVATLGRAPVGLLVLKGSW